MLVEKVKSGCREGKSWLVFMMVDDTGFLARALSEAETGSGGGGEGGGERRDAIFVLYVVQENRSVERLLLLIVKSGVFSVDFLTGFVFSGVECSCS